MGSLDSEIEGFEGEVFDDGVSNSHGVLLLDHSLHIRVNFLDLWVVLLILVEHDGLLLDMGLGLFLLHLGLRIWGGFSLGGVRSLSWGLADVLIRELAGFSDVVAELVELVE